jgi:hypothetical protein
MNRWKRFFARFVLVVSLGLAIVAAVHHRSADKSALFEAATGPTPDAAVALRSLSGGTPQTKPWIDDFTRFAATHSGQWIVGRCVKPCLSQAEARQSAYSDAARAVYSVALGRLGQPQMDKSWLAQRVQADVLTGKLVNDDLVERFERPYGTIWTDTVLLDASPPKLDPLVDRYRSELQARTATIRSLQVGAVLLALSTWLAYFLINMLTRGYFTLRLQLIAGTITAMALLVLLGGP